MVGEVGVKFWAIWRKTGGSAPGNRHVTQEAAVKEAERLAKQTHEEYYVLEVIGKVRLRETPTEYVKII